MAIYTFNEDGTGIYELAGTPSDIKYSTQDGKITIEYEGMKPMTLNYTLEGDTLNIIDSFGNDTFYERQ